VADANVNRRVTGSEYQSSSYWDSNADLLVLDWSELLGYSNILSIGGWQSKFWIEHFICGEDQLSDLTALGDDLLQSDRPHIRQWYLTVPPAVRAGLECLPSCRCSILSLAARHRSVCDLLINNPLLLWTSYYHAARAELGEREFLVMLDSKQIQILQALGYDASKQQIKILRKTAAAHLDSADVLKLLEICRVKTTKDFLSHYHCISKNTVASIREYPWLANCAAKALIPALEYKVNRQILFDTINMADDLELVRRCTSIDALRELHDKLVRELNRQQSYRWRHQDADGNYLPLPEPPVAGGEGIVALSTQEMIIDEGLEMDHCILTYIGRVLDGEYYVYKMTEPERLTIGLKQNSAGLWSISQVKGKRNAEPSESGRAIVQRWFHARGKQDNSLNLGI
jgi:hypothetical protein